MRPLTEVSNWSQPSPKDPALANEVGPCSEGGVAMVYTEDTARYHVVKVRGMLNAVMRHCREDIEKVADPKAQAIFETTAEVLDGLITAYSRYETELHDKARGMAA